MGGTLSITAIVVRNRIDDSSSSPGRGGLRFTSYFGKDMNPCSFLPVKAKL